MERVGIYEAKARLSDLVERAAQGDSITITRHGKPVAKLVPVKRDVEVDRKAIMDEIRAFAKTVKLRKRFTLRDLRAAREWGRR
ncbi:MAG: type II toxin-antitoxin system prevent-host-death family antitoxin [Betaproteobacteria bacterium]|nr:type II toxin-antitoxin system prevent-host-death family antitoxin [Betaproteobacteria bacterium]